jgi:hypothetical protein
MNRLVARIQEEKDYEEFTKLLEELNELIDQKGRRFQPDNKPKP